MRVEFSSKKRQEMIRTMGNQQYDLLIIGGGITGAGIALDAATRGLSVALVDMQDFAAGTSSRSTKLVHGGLRYLKNFEIGLVAEVGKEREIVYENGPHVTTPEWMLLPIHKGGTFGKLTTSVGLRAYDFLAGVKKQERRKMLTTKETLQKEPLLKQDGLLGGGYYVEYKTDDARLTIEVLKEAVAFGAHAISYAQVSRLLYDNGKNIGVEVKDLLHSDHTFQVKAKKTINATGPWVDLIREMDQSKKGKVLRLTKGVHLVIDQARFPLKQAVYFDTSDGRMVFAIPRDGKAYVGTTDTFFNKDARNPPMTNEDREYIIQAINGMFPTVNITAEDIESSWAGVRPLIYEEGKDPSEISRKDEVWHSESGLMTIAGGKLTGYRKMAETVVDQAIKDLDQDYPPSNTKKLPISGGHVGGSKGFEEFAKEAIQYAQNEGLTKQQARYLVQLFGSNVTTVIDLKRTLKNEERFGLPDELFLALHYAMNHEMVVKPEDFFIRRTGLLYFNLRLVEQWKEGVIECMAHSLQWTRDQKESYTLELTNHIHQAVTPMKE
ncbi:glycerol-3-phosphate dehydrogenase/oxidase [Halalkalibacter hemicellulosilyticus]|uniref:Glycerol-3-phosphate dehydrogenase n=1 Tax=Halalkalibacter hemicellulosilyticusJCM 9152 TaxID=1236971 RepID=W4QDY1_9BACI|nr:glycerol-3-phosphate dehydrogenase/oxidase [Halalkalibacter hemicellulosilyticus]GAE29878.1 aerobic glycerol-3-phosphate dehydrogenase [Halalkalibacter hemicellulosilyticusJCM 9152]